MMQLGQVTIESPLITPEVGERIRDYVSALERYALTADAANRHWHADHAEPGWREQMVYLHAAENAASESTDLMRRRLVEAMKAAAKARSPA